MAMRLTSRGAPSRPAHDRRRCRQLKEEFPDVSISKIRYLEDQGLLP